MIKIIYPKGSIITKKDNKNKYCITNIKEDGYETVIYPIGTQKAGETFHIAFEEVDSIFFWGYMDDNYKKEILALQSIKGEKKDVG